MCCTSTVISEMVMHVCFSACLHHCHLLYLYSLLGCGMSYAQACGVYSGCSLLLLHVITLPTSGLAYKLQHSLVSVKARAQKERPFVAPVLTWPQSSGALPHLSPQGPQVFLPNPMRYQRYPNPTQRHSLSYRTLTPYWPDSCESNPFGSALILICWVPSWYWETITE